MSILPDEGSSPVFSGAAARATNNVRGALLLIAAMALFTLETVMVRMMGGGIEITQAVLFRSIGQFIVIGAWAAWRGVWPSLRTSRVGMHVARGLISIASWWAYYLTFLRLEFGLATLLTFASSLFVVLLAGPVMGERVRPVSWIATLVGFAGIGLASGVGLGPLRFEVLLGLLSAAFSAALVFQTRSLTQTEDTVTIMTYIGFFVTAVSVPLAVATWRPIGFDVMAVLLAAGVAGAAGMVLMIEAYGVGETGALAPIPYVRIGFALVLGYVFFGETPSWTMLAGAAVVVASALVAIQVERRGRR